MPIYLIQRTFNEPRNAAIYLVRRTRGDSLKEIGDEFDMKKYSSVSSIIERMKSEISKNRNLRKRIEKLQAILNKRHRLDPFFMLVLYET